MSRLPKCDRSPLHPVCGPLCIQSEDRSCAARVHVELILSLLQMSQKIGGQEKSGLADLVEGREADVEDLGQIAVKSKGRKKQGAAVYKEFEHMQGAPMLYPDEVLVISLAESSDRHAIVLLWPYHVCVASELTRAGRVAGAVGRDECSRKYLC